MDQPIILCGLGDVGWAVLEYLDAAHLPVVVIDLHGGNGVEGRGYPAPTPNGVRLLQGDCRQRAVLEEAGVAQARGVLILTGDDLVNISTALMVRHLQPEVRVVIRLFNQNLLLRLGKAVHNMFALSTSSLAAPILAGSALTGQGLGTFRIEGSGRRQVVEVSVNPGSTLEGMTVADAAARAQAIVLAHAPADGSPRRLLRAVDPLTRLQPGDRLVVCGEPRRLPLLLDLAGEEPHDQVLWANWLRRGGRMAWRALAEMDLPVKIAVGVLLLVVVAGTAVFYLSRENASVPDSLYRTIAIIATVGDMRLGEKDGAGLKIFASCLRILGTALTATFTAIVASYLVRARLHGALEVRRIPDSGHVVVCGLTNVGFRVVEELISYGERVVVLEGARDNRFVTTARRLGAAVVHGDPTVREVLRQVNADRARAVIATERRDLVNLEVALVVREMNPEQRVVLRLADPNLAQMLREAADVRLALPVARLVAPSFLAALFGDRVLHVSLVGDHLLAVVDLLVQPQDTHLIGHTVRAVAVDYRLLPVAVLQPAGAETQSQLGNRLVADSRLIAILELADLERFVRRQPVPANCAVDVTAFPLPARGWLALLLRTQQGLSAEEADRAVGALPLCVGRGLTRGQAEDLLALLGRERVSGQLRNEDGAAQDGSAKKAGEAGT